MALRCGIHGHGERKLSCCCYALSAVLLWALLLGEASAANKSSSSSWKTLHGSPPLIIARGGFSGIFPDSSYDAYSFALVSTSPDAIIMWCDVQLTKDGVGLCLPTMLLDNCTSITDLFPGKPKSYILNGVKTSGYFSVDYDSTALQNVTLIRSNLARSPAFDREFPIVQVTDMGSLIKLNTLWLNIEHDLFYKQHNLSMTSYISSVTKQTAVKYISSPELDFLRSMPARVKRSTMLVFRFLDETTIEPSTNQTYGSLIKNFTFIKTYAQGILVPKTYIWPVTADDYTLPSTSIVRDAHEAGLEIFAAGFANDNLFSYNYSYDPVAEYLAFIDNGDFSVDGVVTDFPLTAAETINCFSSLNSSATDHGTPLIISHNGASGDFPDCTDLSYQKAIDDGADFIDCTVQVTQDGIVICMGSVDLIKDTTVSQSPLRSRISSIPAIQSASGIFTFNLTWDDIKSLRPLISSPESGYNNMQRNPRYKNAGKFLRLSDFLALGKDQNISGVSIRIDNAAFMAEQLGLDIVEAVITAISDAGYSSQTGPVVMIQSPDSSVLVKMKQQKEYKLTYVIEETISDADASSIADVKTFADAVAISIDSIYLSSDLFSFNQTNVAQHFQAANLSVYAYVLRNEFVSQLWDFLSDATVQVNSLVNGANVNGVITDFPGTIQRYRRNSCRNLGNATPNFMLPVAAGGLLGVMAAQPPALPPVPVLDISDVVEPPLPQVQPNPPPPVTAPPPKSTPSIGQKTAVPFLILLATCCASFLLLRPAILESLLRC